MVEISVCLQLRFEVIPNIVRTELLQFFIDTTATPALIGKMDEAIDNCLQDILHDARWNDCLFNMTKVGLGRILVYIETL